MRIAIDASNLRSGGSLTHQSELLSAASPEKHGVDRVVVWGSREMLERLPSRDWLEAVHEPMLDRPLPLRVLWQHTRLARLARRAACDLLFVSGGTYLGDFRPFVTMSRNMLPLDLGQMKFYGASPRLLKFLLLRLGQSKTVRQADGTIFLNDYARGRVVHTVRSMKGRQAIIPHGVSTRFRTAPKAQKPLSEYSKERLGATDYVHYRGYVPYSELPTVYADCDAFVFASSCENLPNCLLEAMNAGLPIACSDRQPMSKILGDGGVYFDPADSADIARALRQLITSPDAREQYAAIAFERVRHYTWERCADETFSFLGVIK